MGEHLGKYNASVKYKMTDDSSWMNSLKQKGLYYEGIVADLDVLLENRNRAMLSGGQEGLQQIPQ